MHTILHWLTELLTSLVSMNALPRCLPRPHATNGSQTGKRLYQSFPNHPRRSILGHLATLVV